MAERYSKRHLAAQVRNGNGLCHIFKFLEILGSASYSLSSDRNKCFKIKNQTAKKLHYVLQKQSVS